MLEKLRIKNFKSHKDTELCLNKLTLLVGTNSSGKSSIIQGLLLIIHNITNENSSPLNGHLISVGNLNEVCNYITNANEFELLVKSKDEEVGLKFMPSERNGIDTDVSFTNSSDELKEYLNYANNKVHYLSANRIGGQDLYNKNFDKYDVFGLHGEYAIDYFQSHKTDLIDEDLVKNKDSQTLEGQVDYWLELFFGQKLLTTSISGTDKVKAEYKLPFGRNIRPKNTGSGISYLISILIICLSSKPDDLIIIENPEIHLHPKAQSNLTDFLLFISSKNRQLIVETHSDHLFNGVRVGVIKNKITASDVNIIFCKLADDYTTDNTHITLSDRGKIETAIPDLFDQFSIDLKTLVGF